MIGRFQLGCAATILAMASLVSAQDEPASAVAQVVPAPLDPAAVTPDPALLSLDFKDADLRTVLQALARKANVNIVEAPGVPAPSPCGSTTCRGKRRST